MGLPNSPASLRSLVSLKRLPIDSCWSSARSNSNLFLLNSLHRSLFSLPPTNLAFFDPSLSNSSIDYPPFNNDPFPIFPTLPSPNSRSPPSNNNNCSRNSHSNSNPSSSLLSHNQDPSDSHNSHLPPSSAASNLAHSQLPSLNRYLNPLLSNPSLHRSPAHALLQKKTFFVFRNGASGIPKHSPRPTGSGAGGKATDSLPATRPSQMRSVQVGEDSYFLRTDSLGVADGVGGWSGKPGANAGLFSSKLMHHCSAELARYEDVDDVNFMSYNQIDPVNVLQHAFERSTNEAKIEGLLGSSTALIAILRNDELRIANIGDCCCSIIRGNDFIFRSEEQQHSFNFPVQIGTNSKSSPSKDAQRYNIKVQKDDIVILSSDGLADNLFDEDILEEVLRFTTGPCISPQKVSESLCHRARTVVEDQQAVTSPFGQRANEEGIHYVGGKNDDISVLVAIVGDLVE